MDRKKPGRKAELPSKRGIAWPRWTGFRGMTVRDWLQLLIVPFALVVIGFLFTMQQDARQQAIEDQRAQREQEIEDQRAQQAQKIENQRAEAERKLAEQRAQDEALQDYLDQMSSLLLKKDLRNSEESSEARTLARARTLTVMGRLNPSRKRQVMQFLVEANLVQSVDERDPIISLADADLSDTDLSDADLSGVDLRHADLRDADLVLADLREADPREADLRKANFPADLSGADLRDADLRYADLSSSVLSNADLRYVDLRHADLYGADLSGTDLTDTWLSNVDLSYADLEHADLSGAGMDNANLSEAVVTLGQLDQAFSLEVATMPDGITVNAGRYASRAFEPALSFNRSDRWQLASQETTNELYIDDPTGFLLGFTSPLHVFAPSNPSEPKEAPAPGNVGEWVSWFQSHPKLKTTNPVAGSVGGVSGVRIDVTETSALGNHPLCAQPCVPLYEAGHTVASVQGWKDRFVIVDVEAETVVINVGAPADEFDELLPKAQKLLDTVEWEGA